MLLTNLNFFQYVLTNTVYVEARLGNDGDMVFDGYHMYSNLVFQMLLLIYTQSFCQKSTESKFPKKYLKFILVQISGMGMEP